MSINPNKPKELLALLQMVDAGYEPTKEEKQWLEKVKFVDLSALVMTELPRSLSLMKNAVHCDLSNNQLTNLSGIENLKQLTKLYCSDNQLTSLHGIENLKQLAKLYCYDNQLESLHGIEELKQLTKLSCHDNQLTSLRGIENLSQLTVLYCYSNQLTSLRGIENLSQLTVLDCDNNPLEELPDCWDRFPALKHADLSGLSLPSLPSSLLRCGLPFFSDPRDAIFASDDNGFEFRGIRLENTQLALQPVSLFDQSRDTSPDHKESRRLIEEYIESTRVPIREGKVILLGEGGVGKTYTVQRMLHGGNPGKYAMEETHGIIIEDLHRTIDENEYTLRLWDFGGQDIMHEMHRCFLTERTLYLIMVDTRHDDQTAKARKYLRTVQTIAPHAKALLMLNEINGGKNNQLDCTTLYNEFPDTLLPDPIIADAKGMKKGEFQKQITDRIWKESLKLDSFRMELPESWEAVRQELLALKNASETKTNYYIDRDAFYQKCDNHGVPADEGVRAWLLTLFNDLGVCFSYHLGEQGRARNADYKILEPMWLTSAAYMVLMEKEATEDGIITHSEIRSILSKKGSRKRIKKGTPCLPGISYSAEECDYVLEIMRKFGIAYEVDAEREFVPALCKPNSKRNPAPTEWKSHSACRYVYPVLPESVIHRLMILCYRNLSTGGLWRKGFWLESAELGFQGVVSIEADKNGLENIVQIDTYSQREDRESAVWLQSVCNLIGLLNSPPELNLESKIEILGIAEDGEAWLNLEHVLYRWLKGNTVFQEGVNDYPIREQLLNYYGAFQLQLLEEKEALRSKNVITYDGRSSPPIMNVNVTVSFSDSIDPHKPVDLERLADRISGAILEAGQTVSNAIMLSSEQICSVFEAFRVGLLDLPDELVTAVEEELAASDIPQIQEVGKELAHTEKPGKLQRLRTFFSDGANFVTLMPALKTACTNFAAAHGPQLLALWETVHQLQLEQIRQSLL